ncbi:hypothetical protein DRQ53_02990 [bacterium]|nr:MAG: hypothetical protein DRQ53_02990 [bacterium]
MRPSGNRTVEVSGSVHSLASINPSTRILLAIFGPRVPSIWLEVTDAGGGACGVHESSAQGIRINRNRRFTL